MPHEHLPNGVVIVVEISWVLARASGSVWPRRARRNHTTCSTPPVRARSISRARTALRGVARGVPRRGTPQYRRRRVTHRRRRRRCHRRVYSRRAYANEDNDNPNLHFVTRESHREACQTRGPQRSSARRQSRDTSPVLLRRRHRQRRRRSNPGASPRSRIG